MISFQIDQMIVLCDTVLRLLCTMVHGGSKRHTSQLICNDFNNKLTYYFHFYHTVSRTYVFTVLRWFLLFVVASHSWSWSSPEEYGCTWNHISLLRPGVIKWHKTQTQTQDFSCIRSCSFLKNTLHHSHCFQPFFNKCILRQEPFIWFGQN